MITKFPLKLWLAEYGIYEDDLHTRDVFWTRKQAESFCGGYKYVKIIACQLIPIPKVKKCRSKSREE